VVKQYRASSALLAFAGCFVFTASAHAACNGPKSLVDQLSAHPTTPSAIQLGSWYASHKQFDCAVVTFRAALKRTPQSAQLHYLTGLALLGGDHAKDAVAEVQESARLEPTEIKPHLLLATIYDQAGKADDAEQEWRKALAIDPKSEQALEDFSASLLRQRKYAAVIGLLGKAPRTEKLAINLSQALGQLNYLDQAATVLTEALAQTPDSLDLPRAMTVVLVKMHRNDQAVKLAQTTADAHPDSMDAKLELFRILVLTSHYDQARPLGPQLLASRPHDPDVLYLTGIIERVDGNLQQAKAHLEESVALNPDFFDSRYHLGVVLVLLHQWKPAEEQLEKAIALDSPVPEVHFELAKALHGLGEADRAAQEIKTYQDLKKTQENSLEASSAAGQGDKALRDGKVADAVVRYREAVEKEPENPIFKYKLSIALRESGDAAGERAQLEETVKIDPKLAAAQNELGFLLARAGDGTAAVEHFRLAIQAAPQWTDAWINLAGELAATGHFAEARQAVTKALTLDPDNAEARELRDQLARDPAAQQSGPGTGPS
jgi:tetratricopeptide (TPR) repeat protein